MDLINLASLAGVSGFLHPSEAEKLCELAAGKGVLEIGAFCGLSAFCMALTAESVLSLDHFCAATDGQRHTGAITTLEDYKRAVARFTNVLPPVVATSEQASTVVSGPFDMVLVDATHTREEVLADIDRWWPKVKPGGVFCGHDYGHDNYPGVKEAFDERFGPAPEGTTVVTLRWVTKPE